MSITHKKEFDQWLNANYEKVMEHYRYLCFKKFSLITEPEIADLFNDSYGRVAKTLTNKVEGEEVNYPNYFYHSLRMRAIEANQTKGKHSKSFIELMTYHDKQDEEDNGEIMDEFRIAVYKEAIRFIEANFEKKYIDIFKYRVLSGMTWPEMVKQSGMSKRTLHYWYSQVSKAVYIHFKTNKLKHIDINEIVRQSKVGTKPL